MTEQDLKINGTKATGTGTCAGGNGAGKGSLQQWAFRARTGDREPAAFLRSGLRVFFIMSHEFFAAAISLRAAALTYAIVLSLVPLLAMSTAILKGLGGGDQLKVAAYRMLDQLDSAGRQPAAALALPEDTTGSGQVENPPSSATPAAPAALPPPAPEGPEAPSATRDLRRAVDAIFSYVDRTNFAAIGAFGIVGVLLTVILVMSTIEDAMNAIWHTNQGRSVLRKVMDYLALLLLLPVSINVAIAAEAILASPTMMAQIQAVIPSPWLVGTLLKLLPFTFVILSLTVMYMFFPSVRVKASAALTGAFFAAVFWFVGQKLYLVLQIGVARSNAIYGSFATLPLFLVWAQLGWTFILLGATLAFAVQNRNLYRLPGTQPSPQHQLQLAFDVLQIVYANFAVKKKTTAGRLIAALKGEQPGEILTAADALVRGGFLLRTGAGNPLYLPTAPAETLEPGEVIRQVLGADTAPTQGGRLAETIIRAAANAVPRAAFPDLSATSGSGAKSSDKEEECEATL